MTIRNALLIPLLAFFTGCTLTEKSVTGKWSAGSDTLFIRQDRSFLFAGKKRYDELKNNIQISDTSFIYSTGKWTVSGRTLYLAFDEEKKEVFGNCDQLRNWARFFSRYKLIRPLTCYEPSNRFVTFNKVRMNDKTKARQ